MRSLTQFRPDSSSTCGTSVWVVLQGVAADEEDVIKEGTGGAVLVQVNVGHHGTQIHRILDNIIIIWNLWKYSMQRCK